MRQDICAISVTNLCRILRHGASSRVEFEEQVKRLAGEAGVSDVLVVGGGVDRPAGPFTSSMDMLSTGIFDRYGISRIAIAGHPEGSPDFSEETALAAMRLKRDFAERSDATMRIVTQFGFDPARFIAWAEGLAASGIDLPVHIGVSGPAKITTLLKYAALCGVGNSIAYLRKNALSLTTLAKGHSPESIVGPIEQHWQANPQGAVRQIHVFPFGGLQASSDWLVKRGSWQTGNTSRSAPRIRWRFDDTTPVYPAMAPPLGHLPCHAALAASTKALRMLSATASTGRDGLSPVIRRISKQPSSGNPSLSPRMTISFCT